MKSVTATIMAPGALTTIKKMVEKKDEVNDLQRFNNLLLPTLAAALCAAMWTGWRADAVGPVLLWVFASLASGGTAGFLFGIPKSAGSISAVTVPGSASGIGDQRQATDNINQSSVLQARPNTNLEEVSDWITKILVGLTLVNVKEIRHEVGRIGENAAHALSQHPTNTDISVATALVVGFALLGFLAVYLYMRLFVQGAIVRSDGQLQQYRRAVANAEKIGERESEQVTDNEIPIAVVPSAASLNAAQEVANAAPPNRPEFVLQPLRQLAAEYEALRQIVDYSRNRTQQMTEIVRKMRPHAIAAAPFIDELTQSPSPGEHLAATVILQMKYMQEHMEWLARRLFEERAFIGYQAASALLARTRVAGIPECSAIQAAVTRAKDERVKLGVSEASLDKLIEQILGAK